MVSPRLAILAILCLAACTVPEDPLPPSERRLIVHAVLDPASRVQMIELSATHGRNSLLDDIEGATVVVMTPDGTPLVARRDETRESEYGHSYTPPIWRLDLVAHGIDLIPGGTYQLRVETRVGDVVTGTTTIPQASPASMVKSTDFFLRERDTLRLSWPAVSGARTYDALIYASYQFSATESFKSLTYQRFAETSLTVPGTARSLDSDIVFSQNTNAIVVVLAVDVNYYEYYRLHGDPFIGAPPSRLSGGLGVFGSVVPILIREFPVR